MGCRNHRTRWTVEETDFLMESWNESHDEETLAAVAELLGRTVEACRQRFYETQWGTAALPLQDKPDPLDVTQTRHAAAAYRAAAFQALRSTETVCPDCQTVRAANGSCLC